uniref:Malonyl CoA-acyl carrier protein transacylase n=1 Tax=Thermodesulfovibrio aggregans TaxID=86166 RepID=A0A7C4EPM9_9BACT
MIAFVFPGQGSQYLGMGKDIAEHAKDVFETASRIVGFDLARLCMDGPETELNRTENTQPAILTVSYALLREVLAVVKPDYVAGHSLGEYTAALCAEVFSFPDAVKITRTRGQLMQQAQPEGKGAMAAILGLEEDKVKQICKSASGYVDVANFNCPGQIVISGEAFAVKEASEIAKQNGAKKVVILQVSIPSHCTLMKKASEKFEEFLKEFKFNDAKIPIVSNVDASQKRFSAEIVDAFVRQLYNPVRWHDCVKYMISKGVDSFVEIGPGKVLSGLIKRIDPKVKVLNVETMNDIEKMKMEL